VHIFQGGRDLLAPDVELLAGRIAAAGGKVEIELVAKAFHVYVGAPWMPEARASISRMAAVLRGA
jgi:acetyl esterase/lipase